MSVNHSHAPSAPSVPHRHSIAQIEDIKAANRHSKTRSNRAGSFALPDDSHNTLQSQLSRNVQQSHMLGHMDKQPPIPPKDTERPRPKPTISATPPPVPMRSPAVPKRKYVPPVASQQHPTDSTCRTSAPQPMLPKPVGPKPAPVAPYLPPIPPPAPRPDKQVKKKEVKSTEFRNKIPPPPSGPPPNAPIPAPPPRINNVPPPLCHVPAGNIQKSSSNNKISMRQDSSVSSDSFSQTSSPSYTTKTMETPLLPHSPGRVLCNGKAGDKTAGRGGSTVATMLARKRQSESEMKDMNGNGALTKSASTPASLQTIVRFHNGSNMSLHHRIIRDMRRPSSHYVSRIRLRFRLAQVVVNAIALLAIGGGLAAYFKAYPSAVQVVNNSTPIIPVQTGGPGVNPAPGICLPVIVSFCQYHKVPYNFTVFPNYMGHFGQRDAQQELEVYDAVVDVRCYELAALFLCSVFVPKCGPTGQVVRPCQKLCSETKRRCGFFLDVFGLALPDYLECNLFPESPDPDVCVGHHEVNEAEKRAQKPVCPSGFQCDVKRCIPRDWKCDGHVDCQDQSDELNCEECSSKGMIHCGDKRCMAQEHLCDGKVDCPLAQDERNCTLLSTMSVFTEHNYFKRPKQLKNKNLKTTKPNFSKPTFKKSLLKTLLTAPRKPKKANISENTKTAENSAQQNINITNSASFLENTIKRNIYLITPNLRAYENKTNFTIIMNENKIVPENNYNKMNNLSTYLICKKDHLKQITRNGLIELTNQNNYLIYKLIDIKQCSNKVNNSTSVLISNGEDGIPIRRRTINGNDIQLTTSIEPAQHMYPTKGYIINITPKLIFKIQAIQMSENEASTSNEEIEDNVPQSGPSKDCAILPVRRFILETENKNDQPFPRFRKIFPVGQSTTIVEDGNKPGPSGLRAKTNQTKIYIRSSSPSIMSPNKRKFVQKTVSKKKVRTILPKPKETKVETQSLLKSSVNGGIIRALLLKPTNPNITLVSNMPKSEVVVRNVPNSGITVVPPNQKTVLLQIPDGTISSVPVIKPCLKDQASTSSSSLISLLTNNSTINTDRKVQPVLPNISESLSTVKMTVSLGKPMPTDLQRKLVNKDEEGKTEKKLEDKENEESEEIDIVQGPTDNSHYESLIDNDLLSHLFDKKPLTMEDVQNLEEKNDDQTVPDQFIVRLSERNGDEGRGQLQVYLPEHKKFMPACVTPDWDQTTSPVYICNLLGYSTSNGSRLIGATDKNISPPVYDMQTSPNKPKKNLMQELGSCSSKSYTTVDLTCTNYICGKTRKSYAERATVRIVGGTPSKPGDWPFLAALLGGPEEVFYCAGVLIADQWVLTASHCVGNHSDVTGWTIQLGITRRHAHSYFGQKVKVRRVVPHPMYNLGVAHDNDIALFQLASPVTFHEHLLPVCLPPDDKELRPGINCTVIGWGKKEDKDMSEYEPAVNEVEVPVLDRDLCNTWLENRDLNVTDGMICAGFKEGGKDACQGDSGGPLLCKDDNDKDRWFVGGIVSWGIKCAHPHLPGVYAYVPKYIRWIKQQMALYSD